MSDTAPHSPEGRIPHVPVMLAEVLAALDPKPGEIFADGTFGAGGYSRAILARGAEVYGFDRDPSAIFGGEALLAEFPGKLTLIPARFSQMREALAARGVTQLDGIVLDIGVSSMQLDQAERGFSFMKDGPLDMRMGGDGPSAADVVNSYEPRDLKRIFAILGEEKRAFNIARGIVKAREVEPITRTRQLALIIEKSYGFVKPGSIHPATRSFQALRIHVNGELDELALALQAAEQLLKPGGRLVVVTFHSLEDRIVKKFLMERAGKSGRPSRHQMADEGLPPSFSLLHSGHIGPTDAETAVNPRSRSAKLRAGIRTDASPHPFSMEALGVPSLEAA
jgi:16S rRNA (cytosine1402-N4)-methyltransferase